MCACHASTLQRMMRTHLGIDQGLLQKAHSNRHGINCGSTQRPQLPLPSAVSTVHGATRFSVVGRCLYVGPWRCLAPAVVQW